MDECRSDVRSLAIYAGDGETEAGVMSEPNEVVLGVEGDFCYLVEDDARVVGVVDNPLGSIEASKTDNTEVSCGGYPEMVVGIDLHVPEAVTRQRRVVVVVGRTCVPSKRVRPKPNSDPILSG